MLFHSFLVYCRHLYQNLVIAIGLLMILTVILVIALGFPLDTPGYFFLDIASLMSLHYLPITKSC